MAFITLATACHQAWSANLFTNATDMFPGKVAGSVVGLGATAGGIGGMFMTLLAGLAVQWTGNQQIVFVWAGGMHLLALALFWFWFKGRFVQVNVDAGLEIRARTAVSWSPVLRSRRSDLRCSAMVYTNWAHDGQRRQSHGCRAGGGRCGRVRRDRRRAAIRGCAEEVSTRDLIRKSRAGHCCLKPAAAWFGPGYFVDE